MKNSVFKPLGVYLSLLALAMSMVAVPGVAVAESPQNVVPAEAQQQYLIRPQIQKGLRATGEDGYWELVTSHDGEIWTRNGILQELMRFEIVEPELVSLESKDASLGRFSLFGTLTPDDGSEIRYVAGILPSAETGEFRRFFPVLASPDVSLAHDMAAKIAEISNGGPEVELVSPIPSDKSTAECIAGCYAAYNVKLGICAAAATACVLAAEAAKDTCDTGCSVKPPEQQPACYANCESTETAQLAGCAAVLLACQQAAAAQRGTCTAGCREGGPGEPPPV